MNGNRRHPWTSSTSAANRSWSVDGRRPPNVTTNASYSSASPSRSHARLSRSRAGVRLPASARNTAPAPMRSRSRQYGVGELLAFGVGADRDRRREESEAGERQTAAEVMAFGSLVLWHRTEHDQPTVVPCVVVGAEPVDPFRPDRQQLASVLRQAPPRPTTDAFALDEALIRRTGDRLTGVAFTDAEHGESVDERLRPRPAVAGQDELTEDRQQQCLGAVGGSGRRCRCAHVLLCAPNWSLCRSER